MSASKGLQPSTLPLRHMVQLAQDLLPFDSAASRGKIILDVGCGPGQVTEYLIGEFGSLLTRTSEEEDHPQTRILASDFSAPMVAQLQKRKERELEMGNAAWGVWKRRSGLREMWRALMSGGVGGCTSWKESEWMVLMGVGAAAAADGDGEPKRKIEMPKEWMSIEGLKREFEEVGFVDVQVVESEAKWSFESHESVVDMILGFSGDEDDGWGGEVGEGGREMAREGMLAWMSERFSEGEGTLSGVAVVGVGRRGE
ncbi:uncharacterized protein EAF02_004629 [Botrytis sinoallii]|uniref:uncharacterized protein n=1 Tax=Botrytis sinoallii TaxID=1463999 RepID=UPI0019016122|nr:uncharacterized protein EAF02_004629 [Botrytis sinoallii]KAF7884293.1 hypothetical protein EAF02_004629 [Botrytis sinoallii]